LKPTPATPTTGLIQRKTKQEASASVGFGALATSKKQPKTNRANLEHNADN
jgi:hypothetical protein